MAVSKLYNIRWWPAIDPRRLFLYQRRDGQARAAPYDLQTEAALIGSRFY